MPLISCPECGGQVSEAAESCPHCGYPIGSVGSRSVSDVQNERESTAAANQAQPTDSIGSKRGLRYPKWAIAWAVIAVIVGVRNVSTTNYFPGESLAMLIDFAFAAGFTFIFWYGVVLLVGWSVRKIRDS